MSEIQMRKNIYGRNQELADQLREQLHAHQIMTLNMISSPGSGKTSIIELTGERLKDSLRMLVIEGDVETERDADRLRQRGIHAIQIQTHGACHLDVTMISEKLASVNLAQLDLLLIENVGNLICPTSFDLAEDFRVIVSSTTEGDDKPVKYPKAFHTADLCLINKIDLLPYTSFSMEEFEVGARRANNHLQFFRTSCKTSEGIDSWCDWLVRQWRNHPSRISQE